MYGRDVLDNARNHDHHEVQPAHKVDAPLPFMRLLVEVVMKKEVAKPDGVHLREKFQQKEAENDARDQVEDVVDLRGLPGEGADVIITFRRVLFRVVRRSYSYL